MDSQLKTRSGPRRAAVPDISALQVRIGTRLRAEREARRVTRDELADRMGISRTSISQLEGGHQNASLEWLYLAASALNAEVKDLLPTVAELSANRVEILESIERDDRLSDEGRSALRRFFEAAAANT
jgi:transcriptional regulator with XRE-family HTH domain